MPNWCSNVLTITGDTEVLSKLKPSIDEGRGLLEAVKPLGEWDYNESIEAWGTKWDIDTEGLQYTDHGDGTSTIEGYFESAWSPPVSAFRELAETCDVELRYFEPGMCFAGIFSSELGDVWYEDVHELKGLTEEDDPTFNDLSEYFDIPSWYEDEEDV